MDKKEVVSIYDEEAVDRALAHMTQSAVKSHNGPADRLQSVGGACR